MCMFIIHTKKVKHKKFIFLKETKGHTHFFFLHIQTFLQYKQAIKEENGITVSVYTTSYVATMSTRVLLVSLGNVPSFEGKVGLFISKNGPSCPIVRSNTWGGVEKSGFALIFTFHIIFISGLSYFFSKLKASCLR